MGNAIEALLQALDYVENRTGGDPQLAEHGIAAHLIALVFGWDWYRQRIAFRSDPDEWMLNGSDEWLKSTAKAQPDVRRLVHANR